MELFHNRRVPFVCTACTYDIILKMGIDHVIENM